MTVLITDPRCSRCGKKLCIRIEIVQGKVEFMCPRCGQLVTFQEGMPKAGKPTE